MLFAGSIEGDAPTIGPLPRTECDYVITSYSWQFVGTCGGAMQEAASRRPTASTPLVWGCFQRSNMQ